MTDHTRGTCCWATINGNPCTCSTQISAHDLRQLKELVVYAVGIYSNMSGDGCFTWRPRDDATGLLSQLSNTLRGIRDLATTPHPEAAP